MNWTERQKKYPKSIVLIKKWLHLKLDKEGDFGLNQISKLFHTERRLFDFFDGEGIFIEIEYDPNLDVGESQWNWLIYNTEGFVYNKEGYHSRIEAEEAGWNKAFEILEQIEN